MKAVVLSAGYGTRLGELTRDRPKPLLDIHGQPLLAYTLRYLASQGIEEAAVNLHHHPEKVTGYFGDGARWGVRLHYSYEAELLGTAGAFGPLRDWLDGEESFLVLYGDVLTDQDLAPMIWMHRDRGAFATLLLHRSKRSNSLVRLDDSGRITSFVERPAEEELSRLLEEAGDFGLVNSGVQVLSSRVLERIADGQATDLPRDIYVPLVQRELILGWPLTGFRVAIDSPQRYEDAQNAVADGRYHVPELTGGAR